MKKSSWGERQSGYLILAIELIFGIACFVPALEAVRASVGLLLGLYFVGHSVRIAGRLLFPSAKSPAVWSPAGIVLDLLSSFTLMVLLVAALSLAFLLYESIVVAAEVMIGLVGSVAALLLSRKRPVSSPSNRSLNPQIFIVVELLFLAAFLVFALFRRSFPYPSTAGWDLNSTLASVGWAVEHHGFQYVLIPPFPSSALLPYPASFIQTIAGYSLLLGVSPLLLFYYGPFLSILASALAVFAIAYRLSARLLPSFVAGVVFLSIGTANPETVRTPLFITIDMIAQLLFLGLITFFLYDEGNIRVRRGVVLSFSLFLAYFYYYEILVMVPIMVLMLSESGSLQGMARQLRLFRSALVAVVLVTAAGVAVAAVVILGGLEALVSPFPLMSKLGNLIAIYGIAFLALLVPSAITVLRQPDMRAVRGLTWRRFGEYAIAYIVVYFLPFWATFRVEFYFRVAIAVLLGAFPLPSWQALRHMFAALRARGPRAQTDGAPVDIRPGAYVGIILTATAILLAAVPMQLAFPEPYMSLDEYRASAWIRSGTAANSYVVTDPGTGFVVRGIALRNASIFFLLSDGRTPADISSIYPNLALELLLILNSTSESEAAARTAALGFTDVYVVVGTRTVAWSLGPTDRLFTRPVAGVSLSGPLNVFRPPHFEMTFDSPTVYVFRYHP